jgi:hypothetical protein
MVNIYRFIYSFTHHYRSLSGSSRRGVINDQAWI